MTFIQKILLLSFAFIATLSSCDSDNIPEESLYVFNDKLVGQYIESDSTLSEFYKLLTKTNTVGLLNSYGEYTVFIPDNQAMHEFYKLKGKSGLEEFTTDSLKEIAYDHIINGALVNYAQFNNGRLFNMTMSDRYLKITMTDSATLVNESSTILQKDILAYNGIIYKISKVLDPVREGIAAVIAKDSTFSLFYEALVATGLVDSILKNVDESYSITAARKQELEDAVKTGIASLRYAPTSRKFGYTLLMESNTTYKTHNIHTLSDLTTYAASIYDELYPEDAGINNLKNRKNSLNRFVAYHIIDKELSAEKFIKKYDTQHMSTLVDLEEFIVPMCPNTLLEVRIKRSSNEYNLFNYNPETNSAIRIDPIRFDLSAENGVYHEIDNLLVYSKEIEDRLSSKRLRFEFSSIFSEFTNNNMRGRPSDNGDLFRNAIPAGFLDKFKCNDQVVICYTAANDRLMNFQGDEVFLTTPPGKLYEFTITTPPVPAGTYEIRFGYQATGSRGVVQYYVDGIPCGVPVNLNNIGSNPQIGWELVGSNLEDPLGYENDKMMRNRGYMKGPNSFRAINESWYKGTSARVNVGNLRKILGTFSFAKTQEHEMTFKGLSSGQFQIDYIEFVPTSALEFEDIN